MLYCCCYLRNMTTLCRLFTVIIVLFIGIVYSNPHVGHIHHQHHFTLRTQSQLPYMEDTRTSLRLRSQKEDVNVISTPISSETFVESFELQNWGLFDQSILTLGSQPLFAVITGETGSGKSVFISALQYLYSTSGTVSDTLCLFVPLSINGIDSNAEICTINLVRCLFDCLSVNLSFSESDYLTIRLSLILTSSSS